jgi:hypothetical protein
MMNYRDEFFFCGLRGEVDECDDDECEDDDEPDDDDDDDDDELEPLDDDELDDDEREAKHTTIRSILSSIDFLLDRCFDLAFFFCEVLFREDRLLILVSTVDDTAVVTTSVLLLRI